MDKKIFSVVVPIHNASRTIERTLASFISNREYIKEVILVNDRTTDDTFEKVPAFSDFFDIYATDNIGEQNPGSARGTGLLAASGEWITFVDADDCLTPTSLKYVHKAISENENVVLLHCKSIYYESGNFNPDTVAYSDTSCGGNFYDRKYLIRNGLFPHETLKMSEDEYFNEKIIKFIRHCDRRDGLISRFDYPVYEVHHDNDEGLSYSFSHWGDYICKYHLLYKEYLTDFFWQFPHMRETLIDEYCTNFIFCFFMSEGVSLDDDVDFDMGDARPHFQRATDYLLRNLGVDLTYLITYYETEADIEGLMESAQVSTGVDFDNYIDFRKFVKSLGTSRFLSDDSD